MVADVKCCRADIERRSRPVRCRVRCWCQATEKYAGNQATASYAAREVTAARIKAAKLVEITVTRNIAVATENAIEALPEIGNHNDVRFIVSGAGFDPCLPL